MTRLATIAKVLPPGSVVIETRTGGEIALPDGRSATWRCGEGGVNVFATTMTPGRGRPWYLSRAVKAAIHAACALR